MIVNEDCIKHLKTIEDNYFDSVVTDPPYHLTFMNKYWDSTGIAFTTELWKEVYRTLKPGGYLLSFAASRNYHRMAVAIEDSGFEIRDQIMWIYGSGFPKSLNIGKQIDKKLGNKRISLGKYKTPDGGQELSTYNNWKDSTVQERRWPEVTKGDSEWEGWGTALKPAHEPICMARKPISEKSVTDNVLKHGTGGINIDGCRVETEDKTQRVNKGVEWGVRNDKSGNEPKVYGSTKGRYPANLIHDGSEEVIDEFKKFGEDKGAKAPVKTEKGDFMFYDHKYNKRGDDGESFKGDTGTAARFFYCAKANKKEKGDSKHPTVKPVELMRYLVRLVTPKDGIVLDPFAGTGTTGEACILEDRNYYLIEAEKSYIKDIENRTNKYNRLGI
jgi:site-specific DNA-methyltransferase (adenine-specific)